MSTVSSEQGALTTARLRALGPLASKIRFGIERPQERGSALRLVFPFKRSWATSIIAGVMLAVFCIPLFTIDGSTDFEGSGDLFSLTSMLFTAS